MADRYTDTLDPEINQNVRSDITNKAIRSALLTIERNFDVKNKQDAMNRAVLDLFESGFMVKDPTGPRKISSKKLYQAVWRMASRMKPLDFTIHGVQRPEEIEKIVTEGVATVMQEGNYVSALRDKQGIFNNLLMYGDGLCMVGANPEKGFPIKFQPLSNSNLYTDSFATGMRGQGDGRNVTKAIAIFSYSWPEFVAMYPEMKSKAGVGKIPRDYNSTREINRDQEQQLQIEDDTIEVAHAYDINAKSYVVFAGSACTLIEEKKDADYPYMMKEEPYIPILQFMCWPSQEGFYNHGVGQMLYDLAIVSRQLMNMEIGHVEDNTYPIELINVPKAEAGKFFNKMKSAYEMRAAGKKGFVAMEYDPTDPNGGRVQSQTLTTQNLFNEWQAVFDRLDNEIKRMGIPLDEIDRGGDPTATQILAEEENANALIKQIMEYNASESKFAVNLTLDFIKQFVSKKDKTPLNMTTVIETPEGEIIPDTITLGEVADELKKHDYFTKINARTGAIPSNVLRNAQISAALAQAQPGSAAQVKLFGERSKLLDIDIKGEDYVAPMPQQAPEQDLQTPVADTERLTFNPRVAEQTPVL